MPTRNDTLKDRLSRYWEIKIAVTGRNSGRAISLPVWFVLDNENLFLLPVQGRIHNGTRTCERTRPFGSMRGARKLNSMLLLLLTPHRCRPWSRNFVASTGPVTSRSTIQSLTLPFSRRAR